MSAQAFPRPTGHVSDYANLLRQASTGAEGYAGALAEHRSVLREAFQAQGGVEVDTQGDAFFDTAAGHGWQGKHPHLVSREHGSWLFLGVMLTSATLRDGDPLPALHHWLHFWERKKSICQRSGKPNN